MYPSLDSVLERVLLYNACTCNKCAQAIDNCKNAKPGHYSRRAHRVCVCVRACVRACVCVCVCLCVHLQATSSNVPFYLMPRPTMKMMPLWRKETKEVHLYLIQWMTGNANSWCRTCVLCAYSSSVNVLKCVLCACVHTLPQATCSSVYCVRTLLPQATCSSVPSCLMPGLTRTGEWAVPTFLLSCPPRCDAALFLSICSSAAADT